MKHRQAHQENHGATGDAELAEADPEEIKDLPSGDRANRQRDQDGERRDAGAPPLLGLGLAVGRGKEHGHGCHRVHDAKQGYDELDEMLRVEHSEPPAPFSGGRRVVCAFRKIWERRAVAGEIALSRLRDDQIDAGLGQRGGEIGRRVEVGDK